MLHDRANAAPVQPMRAASVAASTDPFPIVMPPPPATHSTGKACPTPAPDTADGFDALFRAIPTAQWGAADVGISVPMGDGRVVWLWGDTLSDHRFVHSTAITQDGGCLHVSHGGEQLLPNDGERYYWIERAFTMGGDEVHVVAEEIVADPKAEWGFRYTGYNRHAVVTVDRAGDVTFSRWVRPCAAPQAAKLEDLKIFDTGQIGYSPRRHPEFTLASGLTLKTEARNWIDSLLHPLDTYRPVFTEVPVTPTDVSERQRHDYVLKAGSGR